MPKYNSANAHKLKKLIDDYFVNHPLTGDPFTLESLMLATNITNRVTFNDMCRNTDTYGEEVVSMMEAARLRCLHGLITGGLMETYNSGIVGKIMANHGGYVDKTETKHSGAISIASILSEIDGGTKEIPDRNE